MKPWKLAELNYGFVKQQSYEVAVLPLGCTEPHNLHLPYSQDTLESDVIGDAICAAATEAGAKVILLPTIPYGTVTNQKACPLSMNLNPSTLNAVITDLVDSLAGHGIRKVLILNSHGGNEIKSLMRELYGARDAKLFLCNWFTMVRDVYQEIFEHPEDHAGEMETSIGLARFPELIARNDDGSLAADEGATHATRFEAVNQGWVSITRPWHLLTTNTGSGNPLAASAEKGERVLKVIVQRLGSFLVDLAKSPLDEAFPF